VNKFRPKQRWLRRLWACALAGVVVTVTATWVVTTIRSREVRLTTVPSRTAIIGTWKMEGGVGWIQLGANGRFSATDLPKELFDPGPWQDGVTSTNGTWTLDDRGGSVDLVPVDAPRAEVSNIALGIVERGHATHLCVTSGDPGVLCDFLLQRATN
jgi:hypothetical protein